MAKNKVRYGLKNTHYALITIDSNGDWTYGTPIEIPGAVNMSLSPVGDTATLVADDCDYYISESNNGYDGTLELSVIPDEFRVSCLGESLDSNGVQFENSGVEVSSFALLFEFTGDQHAVKHVLYNCKAARPTIEASATTNKETKTETLNLKVRPDVNNRVKAKTGANTQTTTAETWYDSVYAYTAPEPGA